MPPSINGYNAVFRSFVDFAQQRVNANDAKAIADAKIESPLNGRKMVAVGKAANDSVHNWTRNVDQWVVNDNTRKIFRAAVAKMFGSESRIPENVRKAMLLEDYGQGKPLTARRIMAVKQAIDTWKGDMLPLKINQAKATSMIADATRRLGVGDLDPENADFAAVCLKKYGSGLPAKTARTLANYIVKSAFTDGIDEEAVEQLAKDMKGWREFDFGDPRLGKLGAKFVQRQKNYLKDTLPQSGNFLPDHPDVHSQLVGDANRGEWTICGTKFNLGSDPKAILAKFLESVKDSNARKVLSTLINQSSLADMQTLLVKGNALIGDAKAARLQEEALYKIAGGEMFVSRDTQHNGGIGISTDENVHYDLDISKDGKTATVTVSVDKNLNSIGARYDEYNIGTATISQRITVDLTKAMPEVTDVTFAQTFSPDRIKGAPA